MTLIASLLFIFAFISSVSVIGGTMSASFPQIRQVIDMKLAPSAALDRRIVFGEITHTLHPPLATVVDFPCRKANAWNYRLAA